MSQSSLFPASCGKPSKTQTIKADPAASITINTSGFQSFEKTFIRINKNHQYLISLADSLNSYTICVIRRLNSIIKDKDYKMLERQLISLTGIFLFLYADTGLDIVNGLRKDIGNNEYETIEMHISKLIREVELISQNFYNYCISVMN